MTPIKMAEYLSYDPDVGIIVWRNRSGRCCIGAEAGSIAGRYRRISIDNEKILSHVVAWTLYYGSMPNGQVDHINGNGFDNRISNLRIATASQNLANSRIPKTNTSGYKGVVFCGRTQRWRATIKVNQQRIQLGRYLRKEDAAIAYNAAAVKFFGEFARPNEVRQ